MTVIAGTHQLWLILGLKRPSPEHLYRPLHYRLLKRIIHTITQSLTSPLFDVKLKLYVDNYVSVVMGMIEEGDRLVGNYF